MNNNILIKKIYEKEKDKLLLSYNEFVSIINQLYNNINIINDDDEKSSEEVMNQIEIS